MSYDIFQHKHNFSIWAAARATQRSFTTVENLRDALENCGVVEFLKSDGALETGKQEFDRLHKDWCSKIIESLVEKGVENVTFGRAAKLLAVYLKSMIVVGGNANSSLAQVAHPPIDRILLRNLSRDSKIRSPYKQSWRHIKWTQLNEDEYYRLIPQLATCLDELGPFWVLERFWTITTEREP